MKKFCLVLLVSVLLSSCSKNDVMERTIFIPDKDDSNLPAYTEWGYNSFGAEYERDYFLVSNHIVPCNIVYNKDMQLEFSLSGITHNDNKEMTLMFIFSSMPPMQDYKDLVQLNNVKFNLSDDNACTVKIARDSNETILEGMRGEFHFKRAQLLSIDDKVNRVILSGVFDLQFLKNGHPSYISDGRFDVGITQRVFYAHK